MFNNFIFLFFENRAFYVEKYCRAEQATDDNIAYAHCVLDTYGNKHTPILYNTCCFSHANNSCTNASESYLIRTLRILFRIATDFASVRCKINDEAFLLVSSRNIVRLFLSKTMT